MSGTDPYQPDHERAPFAAVLRKRSGSARSGEMICLKAHTRSGRGTRGITVVPRLRCGRRCRLGSPVIGAPTKASRAIP
jgi:hypothetical protein